MDQQRIRPCVISFANAMELKLKQNDHKGGWSSDTVDQLISKIMLELSELVSTIENGKSSHDVLLECADVANFAMMIAENYRRVNEPTE